MFKRFEKEFNQESGGLRMFVLGTLISGVMIIVWFITTVGQFGLAETLTTWRISNVLIGGSMVGYGSTLLIYLIFKGITYFETNDPILRFLNYLKRRERRKKMK